MPFRTPRHKQTRICKSKLLLRRFAGGHTGSMHNDCCDSTTLRIVVCTCVNIRGVVVGVSGPMLSICVVSIFVGRLISRYRICYLRCNVVCAFVRTPHSTVVCDCDDVVCHSGFQIIRGMTVAVDSAFKHSILHFVLVKQKLFAFRFGWRNQFGLTAVGVV
jgi:hypothetical protein